MKTRLLMMTGIGAVIVCLWFFFGYAPYVTTKERIETDIKNAREQLADFQKTLDELPRYIKTSRDLEQFRSRLSSSLYAKSDILALFERLRGQADMHGLRITEITPPISELLELNRTTQSSDAPQFLNLSLKVKGDYVRFGKYVGQLEDAAFFRGVNFCFISGSTDPNVAVTYTIGFRALLNSEVNEG